MSSHPPVPNHAPRSSTRSLLTATLLVMTGLPLTGCVSLMAKAPPKPEATAIAEASEETATGDVADAAPKAQAPARAGLYTDPMIASAQSAGAPVPPSPARPPQPRALPKPNAALVDAQTSGPDQPANLGELVTQPTAVQAGSNSIYALANAQVAAAEGVPSYAPVRNINPVAGSVFSAPRNPAPATAPADAASGSGPANDGLW